MPQQNVHNHNQINEPSKQKQEDTPDETNEVEEVGLGLPPENDVNAKTPPGRAATTEEAIMDEERPTLPQSVDSTLASPHGMEDAIGRYGETMEVSIEYPTPPEPNGSVPTASTTWRDQLRRSFSDYSLNVIDNAVAVPDIRERIRQLIANAPLVDGRIVETTSQREPQQKTRRCFKLFDRTRRCFIMILSSALILVAIVIGVTVSYTSRSLKPIPSDDFLSPVPSSFPTLQPSSAPTSTLLTPIKSILIPISGEEALSNQSTPQYQALEWMTGQIGVVTWPDVAPIKLSDTERIIQRYAMALLYFSMGGEHWTSNFRFLSNDHECLWNGNETLKTTFWGYYVMGVGCRALAEDLRPTTIYFESNNLTGTIPSELGVISSLEYILLYINNIEGTIPDSLGKLSDLKLLVLDANKLSGTIPPSLGDLSNLIDLWLAGNELTGNIPSSLCELSYLKLLIFLWNDLTGTIPACLGNLTDLVVFDVGENELSGTIPPEFGNLVSMVKIRMYGLNLTGHIPSSIGSLPNLVELHIHDNYLYGTIPPSIFDSTTLEQIILRNNYLTGEIPSNIGNPTAKDKIYLDLNFLTGTIPSSVGDCHNLKTFTAYINMLSGLLPSSIGGMSELRTLGIYSNYLNGTVPKSFQNMTSLVQLDLARNLLTGDINFLCGNSIAYISSDCAGTDPEVLCGCCYVCCYQNNSCALS